LPAGETHTQTYTVTIPHTDFDPGWLLVNAVGVVGNISGNEERSESSATVIIGNPPSGPPAFSPLKGNVRVTGYRFNEPTDAGGHHLGIDMLGTGLEVFSPFAQPAEATFVGGTCGNVSYGQYVELTSGEWKVLMAHFGCNQIYIGQGDTVNSNTVIGVVGLTGRTSGLHQHYEVFHNGVRVDPELYNALLPHP
jgi:murein DD-endopeptidase MepM/ murein hydrolase activator NlpD